MADMKERQLFLESVRKMSMMSRCSSKLLLKRTDDSVVKVYELLGAEVFLYLDVDGTQVTARVDPRTTAKTGDPIKYLHSIWRNSLSLTKRQSLLLQTNSWKNISQIDFCLLDSYNNIFLSTCDKKLPAESKLKYFP